MQVNLTKKTLMAGLETMRRIIPSRSSNPLLTSMMITGTAAGVTLTGTNLEVDAEVYLPAEVQNPQQLVIPAHLFAQSANSLAGELVEMRVVGSQVTMVSAGSTFRFHSGDVEAYPVLEFPHRPGVTLAARQLATAITNVRYAASPEAFQAVFRGLKFEFSDHSLALIASDGFRVARHEFPMEPGQQLRNLIVPARSCEEMLQFLKNVTGDCRMSADDGVLTVETDAGRMNFKLMDGDFPDYERVIPRQTVLDFTCNGQRLREAADRVAILADKNANNRLELTVAQGQLRIVADGDYGEAEDILQVEQSGPEPAMALAVNARHLLDALAPVRGDVRIGLSGSTSPLRVSSLGDSGYLAVLVTLRV